MKVKKQAGGFSISFGEGVIGKLTNKAQNIQADLNKWGEVVGFMERRAKEGDAIAEAWVREISLEMYKADDNIIKTMTLSKKMFTEKNRIAVNATIQRNYRLENFISATDWENRTFDLSVV